MQRNCYVHTMTAGANSKDEALELQKKIAK